jgi:hypothetical protein
MVLILRNAKVFKPTAQLRITALNRHVVVLTDRSSTAQDRDCKIDAVLCAKTLLDAYGEQITQVKVLFSRGPDLPATQVTVIPGDVKAYGSGQIPLSAFLDSIDLVEVKPDSATAAPGAGAQAASEADLKRAQLKQRIDALKARGTGVKPFENILNKIEQEESAHQDKQAAADIDFLSEKLGEQESTIKAMSQRPKGAVSQPVGVSSPVQYNAPPFTPPSVQPVSRPASSPDAAALEARAREWDKKVDHWKKMGRNVDQLAGLLALIHTWITDPNSPNLSLARDALDKFDQMSEPPP